MHRAIWLAVSLLLVLAIAACGGDDDDTGTGATATTIGDATATDAAGSTDSSGGETFIEIDAADFSFSPNNIILAADIELSFVVSNTGDSPHTLKLFADEDYTEEVEGASTGNIPTVTIGQFKVTLPVGDYFFRCELHPDRMTGTIAAQ